MLENKTQSDTELHILQRDVWRRTKYKSHIRIKSETQQTKKKPEKSCIEKDMKDKGYKKSLCLRWNIVIKKMENKGTYGWRYLLERERKETEQCMQYLANGWEKNRRQAL